MTNPIATEVSGRFISHPAVAHEFGARRTPLQRQTPTSAPGGASRNPTSKQPIVGVRHSTPTKIADIDQWRKKKYNNASAAWRHALGVRLWRDDRGPRERRRRVQMARDVSDADVKDLQWRRGWDSNPRIPVKILLEFQSSAFDRSATSPINPLRELSRRRLRR